MEKMHEARTNLQPGGWLDTDEQIIYTAGAGKAVHCICTLRYRALLFDG